MATIRERNRPLFHRFANREAVNFTASMGGKVSKDGNNVLTFTGEFALNNPLGTYWSDHVQNGALILSEGVDSEIGGKDRIRLIADGSGIDIPAEWINVGVDAISEADGDINIIEIVKVSDSEINYRNFILVP